MGKDTIIIHMNEDDAKVGICEKCGRSTLSMRDVLANTNITRYNCTSCGRIESFKSDGSRKEASIWDRFQ